MQCVCVCEDARSEGSDGGVKLVDGGEEVKNLSHHLRHNKQWERITLSLLLSLAETPFFCPSD